MAPIVLKVKGNMQSLPFGNLDSSDDLSKTWRVCTKVKDSLENGSRLENLSWRLWFAHNVNKEKKQQAAKKKSSPLTPNNFKVPEDFDFKAQNEKRKQEEYKRKLSLQQKKQAQELLQNNFEQQQKQWQQRQQCQFQQQQQQQQQLQYNQAITLSHPQYYNRQFTLHQFTSDQAGDQVIELDDIFKSFGGGGDMRAYLDPNEEQQLDVLINESWPITSSSATSSIHDPYSTTTSPTQLTFPQQQYNNTGYDFNISASTAATTSTAYDNSNNNETAMYVSAEQMPPIPIGTLHNKLLATLPRETLESANRLLLNNNTTIEEQEEEEQAEDMEKVQVQQQQQNIMFHNQHQSTPNTPFTTSPTSFKPVQMNNNTSSYRFFMPPQPTTTTTTPTHHNHNTNNQHQHYTFSHHNHNHQQQHSKSLPPSRAASPPPQSSPSSSTSVAPAKKAKSNSASPSTTTTTTQKRAIGPINTSPSEGKAPICSNCGTASTPLWRRSANDELLCNACGLYLKLHNAPRPKYLKPQSSRKDSKGEDENIVLPLCSNCGTSTTPLWRRDLDGAPLCNACGLYLKLHHEKRPLSMKTDNIKKRQRCDNSSSSSSNSSSSTNKSINLQQQPNISFSTPSSASAPSNKKKNRSMEESTLSFDTSPSANTNTNYQYMEDVIPTNNNNNNNNNEYSPFGNFGLSLSTTTTTDQQPI